jgi:hypothetical protein
MADRDALVFDSAVLIDSEGVTPECFNFGADTPVDVRPLRKFPDGTLRSGLLQLPRAWTSGRQLRVRTALQIFVRRGRIALDGRTLEANAFIVVPAGSVIPVLASLADTELLVILDEGQAFEPLSMASMSDGAPLVIIDDVFAIEPIVPVIAGQPLVGFERRVLWLDSATGADTRLLRIPAGFTGGGANWHPVNEEIFCLDGEIEPSMGNTMTAGWFLWNPVRSVHGFHEMTRPGCVLLEWHDGPWDLIKFRQENPESQVRTGSR